MFNKKNFPFVDNTDPNYPDGKIVNSDGSGQGTRLNFNMTTDVWEFFAKLLRKANVTANDQPDNESNGFQTIEALQLLPTKNDFANLITSSNGQYQVGIKLGILEENESLYLRMGVNAGSETNIKGVDDVVVDVDLSNNGAILSGDYVHMVFTAASGLKFNRIISFNQVVDMLNGLQSSNYLASSTQNGLLSSTYFKRRTRIAGTVQGGGTINSGSGFSVDRLSLGVYRVNHNFGTSDYVVGLSSRDDEQNFKTSLLSSGSLNFVVETLQNNYDETNPWVAVDHDFAFSVISAED